MCQQRMPMEVTETPNIPLEVEAARETKRIEREVEKLAAEIKHDCRIYTEIWSDIRKSQTAEQKARWKEVQAFLRRGIRLNLSMLEWYEEVHSFDFPEEYPISSTSIHHLRRAERIGLLRQRRTT